MNELGSIDGHPQRAPHPEDDGQSLMAQFRQRLAVGAEEEFDLRQLLMTLWRRKWMILLVAGLLTTLVTLTVFQLTPRYTASANVMLDTRQSKVTDIESVVSGISSDMAAVLSEVEVIHSGTLIRRVVDKLNLVRDPEFNPDLIPVPWYAEYLKLETYVSKDLLISIGLRKPEINLSDDEAKERKTAQIINAIQGRLAVDPVRRSLVISITFTSTNPRKAALIANTIADHYIVDQLESKFEATRRATNWLNDRIGTLKDKVKSSESAVENYRSRLAGRIGQSSKMTTQQISELNTQLILARTKKAQAAARLDQIEQLINSKSGGISSAAEVLASPLIQRLREQEAQVVRKVSELQSRYGERHPTMIKAIAELRDLRSGIEREVRKVEQSIRNELQVSAIGERTLKNALDQLEVKSRQEGKAEIRLRELQREAQANKLLYENFLSRFKETSSQENLQQADARIIARAQVPIEASFPKKRLTVILAAVMSLFIGVVLVFLIEQMENSFRSSEEVEEVTGLPAIGMIPLITGMMDRRQMGRFMAHKPSSTVGEAVRNLRTSIMLSNVDHPPKVVCVTSSIPAEGKTTTAIWLAQNTAMSGQKVLLIDCDLRHPSVHNTLGLDNSVSLVELLSQTCTLEDVVTHDEESGLFVICAKEMHANSMDLLASNHMKRLLDGVREHFDLIVLDAAPVLAVSDARVVGKLADKVLYVIKWNETPRNLVRTGLRTALDSKMEIAGLVLSQVNTRKHAKYGYGDYGHYYGKYKTYYNN